MNNTRRLSADPIRRKVTNFHVVEGGDAYVIEAKQDVSPIIERNKARMAATDERTRHSEWEQYAEIPTEVWYGHLVPSGIANDEKRLRKWLDNRDNLLFRTRPGRLSK